MSFARKFLKKKPQNLQRIFGNIFYKKIIKNKKKINFDLLNKILIIKLFLNKRR